VAAEGAARAFVNQVPEGFSVGLITFAGDVQVRVPPTSDRGAVIDATTSLVTSEGTFIGDGLTKALDILQEAWQRQGKGPAAIVLLSDGQDTGSAVSPTVAAARSKGLGVRVFTVTVGQPDTGAGGASGANAALLQQIAATTGATTFTAQTAADLTRVYQSLGSQLSTELAVTNLGAYFMVAAVILAVVAGALALLASRNPY
jgi:Ca-activated chloride channel family protein